MDKNKLRRFEDIAIARTQPGKVEQGCLNLDTLPPETVAGAIQALGDIGAIRRTSGSSQEVKNGQQQIEEV